MVGTHEDAGWRRADSMLLELHNSFSGQAVTCTYSFAQEMPARHSPYHLCNNGCNAGLGSYCVLQSSGRLYFSFGFTTELPQHHFWRNEEFASHYERHSVRRLKMHGMAEEHRKAKTALSKPGQRPVKPRTKEPGAKHTKVRTGCMTCK
jgi:hypothetical protein